MSAFSMRHCGPIVPSGPSTGDEGNDIMSKRTKLMVKFRAETKECFITVAGRCAADVGVRQQRSTWFWEGGIRGTKEMRRVGSKWREENVTRGAGQGTSAWHAGSAPRYQTGSIRKEGGGRMAERLAKGRTIYRSQGKMLGVWAGVWVDVDTAVTRRPGNPG